MRTPFSRALLLAGAVCAAGIGCKPVPTVAPGGAVIRVFANPSSVSPGGSSVLDVSVFEASGQPVPDGTVVTFTTTLGVIEPNPVETKGGFASATFRAGTDSGSAEITASSGLATSSAFTISVGGADSLSLGVDPATLPAGGGSSLVTATVFDVSANRVPGVQVTFATNAGTLASGGAPRTTDTRGEVSDTLTTDTDATVTVEIVGETVEAEIAVDVAGTGVASITLTADPDTLPAGGGTTAIVASAIDADGEPVVGLALAFSSDAGSLGNQGAVFTGSAGTVTNTLNTDLTASVEARSGGVSGRVTVTVDALPSNARLVELTIDPTNITTTACSVAPTCSPSPDQCLEIELVAEVTLLGAPVSGAQVIFTVERPNSGAPAPKGGFCDSPTATTDANGIATAHYNLSAADLAACEAIVTPCPNLTCSFLNRCCCALRFWARSGTDLARQDLAVMAEADSSSGGVKMCTCPI